MKLLQLLSLLFFLPVANLFAQTPLPLVYEIKTDTATEQELDVSYYQMLEDRDGKLTIDEVTKLPLSNKFHKRGAKINGADTIVKTYWFRYRIKNIGSKETKIALDSRAYKSDFYVFEGTNKPKHYASGEGYPWSKKNGFKRGNYIPLVLQTGEELLVYYRIYNDIPGIPAIFKINFLSTEKLIQTEYLDKEADYIRTSNYQDFFFLGFFLLAAMFNFFFYWIIKEKVYLYFSLMLLFHCITNIVYSEILGRVHPEIVEYVSNLRVLTPLFLVYFIRSYFKTSLYFPRLDKSLLIVIAVYLITCTMWAFWGGWYGIIYTTRLISIIILFLCIFITLFHCIRKWDKPAKLFLIATFPTILMDGIAFFIVAHYFHLINSQIFLNGGEIGITKLEMFAKVGWY